MMRAAQGTTLAMHTVLAVALAWTGWPSAAASAAKDIAEPVSPGAVLRTIAVDPAVEERVLALDPEHISDREVLETLVLAPAPRIINLHGSVPFVTMQPFAEFLIAMGYPAERLRNPRDGSLTYSSFADSRELAGKLAWHYEREGMVPMLIGHSQGGMLAIKVLQDLAGASGDRIAVWNPLADEPESRFAVVDPLSGGERAVVGLRVPYASALATGSLMRLLLGQWGMLPRLRSVPDTVDEFTGFFIDWDPIAGTFAGAAESDPYRATGTAAVRNVTLPADYGHISLPITAHLAANPATRAWISDYSPRGPRAALPAGDDLDTRNIVHAADIWYSVKKHWCLEAQRLFQAKRALTASGG